MKPLTVCRSCGDGHLSPKFKCDIISNDHIGSCPCRTCIVSIMCKKVCEIKINFNTVCFELYRQKHPPVFMGNNK